jgi:histidine triad (HIT) family protein
MPCPFCEIAQGRAQASFVHEDEGFVAFLDHRPLFEGHVLVVPRVHVPTLAELDLAQAPALLGLVQRVMHALEVGLGAAGTFVATNSKVSQSVPHLHFHVVPRRPKDGLKGFFWPRTKYASDARMAEVAEKIRAAMGP